MPNFVSEMHKITRLIIRVTLCFLLKLKRFLDWTSDSTITFIDSKV